MWCEKEALAGVLVRGHPRVRRAAHGVARLRLARAICYSAADAITDRLSQDGSASQAVVYYFGDYDPSGLHISQSIEAGLRRLCGELLTGFAPDDLSFERVAVTDEQIERCGLPTRPTKVEGNRHAKDWAAGRPVVELDAIPPGSLRAIARRCIEQHLDRDHLAPGPSHRGRGAGAASPVRVDHRRGPGMTALAPPAGLEFLGAVPSGDPRFYLMDCPACLAGAVAIVPEGDDWRIAGEVGCSAGCGEPSIIWWHMWRTGDLPPPLPPDDRQRRYAQGAVRRMLAEIPDRPTAARLRRVAYDVGRFAEAGALETAPLAKALAAAADRAGIADTNVVIAAMSAGRAVPARLPT